MNPSEILVSLSKQGKAKEQVPPWAKASGTNGWLYLFWQAEAVVSPESQPKPSELGVDSSHFSNVFVNSHFFFFNSPCCFNYISQCWEHHSSSSVFQYYL